MKKKVFSLLLAALLLFALCACEASSTSSSSTTISTSVTDAEGKTTTNSVTNEVSVNLGTDGVSVTNNTTTDKSSDDAIDHEALRADMLEQYTAGAEGTSAAGERILLAVDDLAAIGYAQLMIVSSDGQSFSAYSGSVYMDGDQAVLDDEVQTMKLPFDITEAEEDNAFTLTFLGDGDVATMVLVDTEQVIDDMLSVLTDFGY